MVVHQRPAHEAQKGINCMKYIRGTKEPSRVKYIVWFIAVVLVCVIIGYVIGNLAYGKTWDVEYPMANQHIEWSYAGKVLQ